MRQIRILPKSALTAAELNAERTGRSRVEQVLIGN